MSSVRFNLKVPSASAVAVEPELEEETRPASHGSMETLAEKAPLLLLVFVAACLGLVAMSTHTSSEVSASRFLQAEKLTAIQGVHDSDPTTVATFTHVGQGYCRGAGYPDAEDEGVYIVVPSRAMNESGCRALCAQNEHCAAYEYRVDNRCELHLPGSNAIAKVRPNPSVECYAKDTATVGVITPTWVYQFNAIVHGNKTCPEQGMLDGTDSICEAACESVDIAQLGEHARGLGTTTGFVFGPCRVTSTGKCEWAQTPTAYPQDNPACPNCDCPGYQCIRRDQVCVVTAPGMASSTPAPSTTPMTTTAVTTTAVTTTHVPTTAPTHPPSLLIPGRSVALKSGKSGEYCCDEGNKIKCDRTTAGPWCKFTIVDAGSGKIALKGGRYGKYCADEFNKVKCNRDHLKSWEKFTVVDAGSGKIALKGGRTGRFYCSDTGSQVKCNRLWKRSWEEFTVED